MYKVFKVHHCSKQKKHHILENSVHPKVRTFTATWHYTFSHLQKKINKITMHFDTFTVFFNFNVLQRYAMVVSKKFVTVGSWRDETLRRRLCSIDWSRKRTSTRACGECRSCQHSFVLWYDILVSKFLFFCGHMYDTPIDKFNLKLCINSKSYCSKCSRIN